MSFSDFYPSDLTDITSSSDDDGEFTLPSVKRTGTKKAKKDQRSPYTITNPLRPPRSTSYSVRALYEQIVDGSINLDPDYQRDIVWPEQKQVGLVDSLFRNYYIPPIIFAVSTSEDGSEFRVCIDGKQRLTSIQKFMDGLIPHRDHVTARRYWYKKYGDNTRLPLPTPLQQAFANKQIVCVEYDSLSEEQEREIFQRVQLGVALTPAERMQAITGPWPNFVREIQSQVLGDDGFGNSFDWGRARGRDFHGLASAVYLIEQLPTCKVPPTTQTMEKWLTRTTAVPPKLRTGVLDTFRVYLSLVRDKNYKKPFAQRVSPIEFVMIGVMIYMKRETLSLTQLSHAVEKMRSDVRSVEKDVRSNGRVGKLLFKFIIEKLPRITLHSDGKGDKSAQSTLSTVCRPPLSGPIPATSQGATTTTATAPTPGPKTVRATAPKKRKRQVEDDDSDRSSDPGEANDHDYVSQPRRSAGRPATKAARSALTTERRPSVPEPEPQSASAPPHTTCVAPKTEKNKSITPTPSLTPLASSKTETDSASVTPAPPPSTPQILSKKPVPFTAVGPHRTPMDRLAALRASSTRTVPSSASVSTSPTAVVCAVDEPPDQPEPGSAIAPIDLESLEKLQQILSLSAGLKAIADASFQQQPQSPLPQHMSLGNPPEGQNSNNLDAVLALQQLEAILSLPRKQAQQQTQDPPNEIAIPQPAPTVVVQPPPQPVIKTECIEPGLSVIPVAPKAMRGAGNLPHHLDNHSHLSPSYDYDRYSGARRPHEYEFERGRGRGRERGRGYHRRGYSRCSYSPRSRSRSRSFSRSRSRSRSRTPSRPKHRLRSRSRSWERERDYGYQSPSSSTRAHDWHAQARLGASARSSTPGPPVGVGGGGAGGGGGAVGLLDGSFGSGPGSASSVGRRRSSPTSGYAPRKFDYTSERKRREREYHDYLRERKVSGGAPGASPGGFGSSGYR